MSNNRRRAAILGCLIAAMLVAVPMAASAAGGYKLGRYKGKTSQHQKLVLALSHAFECTASTYNIISYCLATKTQAYVTLKCPDGSTINNYIDAYGSLNRSGVLKYKERASDGVSTTQVYLKVSRSGTIKGWAAYTGPESIETTTSPLCKSGKVTFTLHHS